MATEPDPVCAAALDLARAAAVELAHAAVGDHLGLHADEPYVVTHTFASTLAGYQGWNWAVTVARAEDCDVVTVDEVVLLPGHGALLAPAWVPWNERMRPGDLSPGDLAPPRDDDPRLVPAYAELDPSDAYETWDDWQVDLVADEIGFGRVHVLSLEGRLDAVERWEAGDGGPNTEMARLAPAHCGTCGFLLALAGSLRGAFGVCGNELALADGRVVSVEHGCGAHSEAVVDLASLAEPSGAIYDDGDDIVLLSPPAELVPVRDEQAEQAHADAGDAGPEPAAVMVAPELVVEGQQDDRRDDEEANADEGEAR